MLGRGKNPKTQPAAEGGVAKPLTTHMPRRPGIFIPLWKLELAVRNGTKAGRQLFISGHIGSVKLIKLNEEQLIRFRRQNASDTEEGRRIDR